MKSFNWFCLVEIDENIKESSRALIGFVRLKLMRIQK
jgi:hypothetical protein